MTQNPALLLPVVLPVAAGIALPLLPALREDRNQKLFVTLILAAACLVTVPLLVSGGALRILTLTENAEITLRVDGLTRVFAVLMLAMWVLSGLFSFEYMKHEGHHTRYYAFYLVSLGALLGLSMAANYLTLYLFFEWMTLMTMPLVLHSGTEEATQAALKYLLYSITGASLGLLGIPLMLRFAGTLDFIPGGVLNPSLVAGHEGLVLGIVFAVVIGFGAKAGLFPLFAWLPTAHPVAPAPASAVLSGVITKAGVLSILRVIYYQVGTDFLRGTWVQTAWCIIALITVFMGSTMALKEKVLKKRMAYSTVSQVSYVLFGLFLMNTTAFTGALLHVFVHSICKDALFLSAGAIIYMTHRTRVDELRGIGKEMPICMWCFTIASLGLIGIPPLCGFLSKWYLCLGSLESDLPVIAWLGPVVLIISAILTAAYLLSITVAGFFPGADFDYAALQKHEPNAFMTVPLLVLAAAAFFTLWPAPLLGIISAVSAELF